jgi:hypothetical protein
MSLYIILFLILVTGLVFLSVSRTKPIVPAGEFVGSTGSGESADPAEILFSESDEIERLNELAREKRKQRAAIIL